MWEKREISFNRKLAKSVVVVIRLKLYSFFHPKNTTFMQKHFNVRKDGNFVKQKITTVGAIQLILELFRFKKKVICYYKNVRSKKVLAKINIKKLKWGLCMNAGKKEKWKKEALGVGKENDVIIEWSMMDGHASSQLSWSLNFPATQSDVVFPFHENVSYFTQLSLALAPMDGWLPFDALSFNPSSFSHLF